MPFTAQTPRPYNKADVESLTPNQNGVYGIFKGNICIYVGKGDIRQRLLAHLNNDNPCITKQQPTTWVGEKLNGDPSAREKELILELNPVCNQKVG